MYERTEQLIIDSIYKTILRRPADPSGMAHYEHKISQISAVDTYALLVRDLLGSREYANNVLRSPIIAAEVVGAPGTRLVNGRPLKHIASLGTHCLASSILKRYGYKRYSLPFDWGFSSPLTLLHCLRDNFAMMLDRAQYVSLAKTRATGERGATHLFYSKEHGVGDMFAHRDPTEEDDYRYLCRTVDRFRILCDSEDAKLFFMIVQPQLNVGAAFIEISRTLRSLTRNSAFICIQLRAPSFNIGCHSMRTLCSDQDHELLEFTPSSREGGMSFSEPIDNLVLVRLLRQFDIQLVANCA